MKQDVQEEEEALVTGDYWQVDGLRRELIRERRALEGKTMYKIKEDYVILMMSSEVTLIGPSLSVET